MMNQEIAVNATNLTKNFGEFVAVAGIDFTVEKGKIFGFLGPNGSGKTTTIRMMLGLMQPTAGEVEILGMPVSQYAADFRPRVGYMSQQFSLYNDLTVLQNLRFYGKAYGLSNAKLEERINAALALAGLEGREKAKTHELSGGWRQRLALSAAILHEPEVVFLDEPTAGVDPVSRRAFWDLLYQLITQGITVFVTTHYMDEAEHCHRLAFLQRGKIIAQGSPAGIKGDVMHGQVLEIAPTDPIKTMQFLRQLKKENKLEFENVELYGSLVHVITEDAKPLLKNIKKELKKAKIDTGQISIIDPSLEDVFIAAMK